MLDCHRACVVIRPSMGVTQDIRRKRRAVLEAVRRVGGPTKAANVCGINPCSIYRWLRKGRIPRARAAEKLSTATGIPFNDLFGQADPAAKGWGGVRHRRAQKAGGAHAATA